MPRVPSPFVRPLLAALAVLALSLAPSTGRAQAGPVLSHTPNNWYVGPGGSVGFSIANGVMTLDADSNGVSEHHPLPQGVKATDNIKLSPSRTVMYTSVGPRGNCGGNVVRFYTIPLADNAPMTALADSICLPSTIAFIEFFDRPAFWGQRIACVAVANVAGQAQILCVDLVSGAFALTPPISGTILEIHFAPSGIAAWVKSGTNGSPTANFTWVELCPASLGNLQADPFLQNLLLSGPGFVSITAQVQANGPAFDGVTFYPDPATERSRIPLPDCAPPPTLGACCLAGGGCLNVTSGDCSARSGTWQGAGTACATAGCPPPPAPDLQASITGPASVLAGYEITYAIVARNLGNAASNSVVLNCPIPSGSTWVRASNGGFLSGATARWNLGTLAPSAAVTCSLTVKASCFASSVVAGGVTIQGTPGGTVNGTGTVTTTVIAHPTTNMPFSITTTPLSPQPLQTGQKVRHTITFTNTLGVSRPGLTLDLRAGSYSTMDAAVSATTGTATVSGDFYHWSGDAPASQSVTLVFDTRVTDCRPPGTSFERLNAGLLVAVRNPCLFTIGFALPGDTLVLGPPPLHVAIVAPSLGPVQRASASAGAVAAGAGGTTEFTLWIANLADTAGAAANVSLPIGPGLLPVGNPPFVAPAPAGSAWDSTTRTITWTGVVPARDSVRVAFRALVDAEGAMFGALAATGSSAPCTGNLAYTLSVLGVRPEPVEPHLLGLSRYEGVWAFRPGTSTAKERLVGYNSATQNGLARTPSGDLWIAAPSVIRVNPGTGALELFDATLNAALDIEFPSDVAWDAGDSTLVFAGYTSGRGLRVARWNPRTRVATTLYTESNAAHGPAEHVKVDAQRRVWVESGADLIWIDPAAPLVGHTYHDASYAVLRGLAIDVDQDVLVLDMAGPNPHPGRLASVGRASGVFTHLPGADTLQSFGSPLVNLAVAGDSSVYASFDYGSIVRLARPSWALTTFPLLGYNDDLEWVGGAPTAAVGPAPAPAGAPLAFAPPSPNPANGPVRLAFTLPQQTDLRLEVFDLGGRRIRELLRGTFGAGPHAAHWDGFDASGRPAGAGLYFLRLVTGAGTCTRRLVLAR